MYFIQENVLNDIKATIGEAPFESGGIIGIKDNVICAFYFEEDNVGNAAEYLPNPTKLNYVLRKWRRQDIFFIGMVHSHANGYNRPSYGDEIYAKKLMRVNPFLESLLFPIVTIDNGEIKIAFYEYVKEFKGFYPIQVELLSNT